MKLKQITGLLAFCLCTLGAQSVNAASCSTPANGVAMLNATGPLVEGARRGAGAGRISRNAQLDAAAQQQACWVGRKGYNASAAHTGSGGSTPMKRVKRTGYRSCLTAENLGYAQTSPEQIVQDWMASPGHRANITLNGVKEYGLGLAMHGNSPVWILVLAKPC